MDISTTGGAVEIKPTGPVANIDTHLKAQGSGRIILDAPLAGTGLGTGDALASATALVIPVGYGRGMHITGTTAITSITATNVQSGTFIVLIFDGILTFTDGNNLKLAGDMATSADDTITLFFDGANFYEIARSAN